MTETPQWLLERLGQAAKVRLFLDYDGTLADFAPTPDVVVPDPEVAEVVTRLSRHPQIRVAVVSGRRLSHIEKLVPVKGILLAGTYGVELLTPEGEHLERVPLAAIRPALDKIKPQWEALIAGRDGFYLEDKNWSLALHARYAREDAAEEVLRAVQQMAVEKMANADETGDELPVDFWRVLGGHRFHEIGPDIAHKGKTIEYLMEHFPWPGALLLYLGDDDKDEEAFAVIKERGGVAVLVSPQERPTRADFRLENPHEARQWLEALPTWIGKAKVDSPGPDGE